MNFLLNSKYLCLQLVTWKLNLTYYYILLYIRSRCNVNEEILQRVEIEEDVSRKNSVGNSKVGVVARQSRPFAFLLDFLYFAFSLEERTSQILRCKYLAKSKNCLVIKNGCIIQGLKHSIEKLIHFTIMGFNKNEIGE